MKITKTARLTACGGLAVALLAGTALPAAAGGVAAAKPAPPAASAGALADDGVDTVDDVDLQPYAEQVRPLPGPNGHDYKYTTSTNYWSVVATKPIGRTDVNLRLYDDKNHTQLLASSAFSTGKTDFIAVDSNHRPFGSYFPEVKKFSGFGSYRVELAHGSDQLGDADETVAVSSSDVVLVRDTWLVGGEEYFFALTGVQGAVLYLMGSSSGDSSTWVRSRAQAIDSTDTGSWPIFSFTPPTSDWYGVVVTLPGTAGSVTMIRSGGPGPS